MNNNKTKQSQFPIFNIQDFGAVPDGLTLNTQVINNAIAACAEAGGGTVYIPPGTFICGSIYLQSQITLYLEAGATLRGSPRLEDYVLEGGGWYEGSGESLHAGLVTCRDAERITIRGRGIIDGAAPDFHDQRKMHTPGDFDPQYTRQGQDYMHPRYGNQHSPLAHGDRPGNLVRFFNCKNVLIKDVTIQNSPTWTVLFENCEDVRLSGLNINSHASDRRVPNDDGVDLKNCRFVRISDCNIQTGDDCLAVFSGESIVVTNCTLVSRSSGIRLGFTGSDLRDCSFINLIIESNRGILANVRGENSIENILFSNISIRTQVFIGHWWGNGEPIHISVISSHVDGEKLGTIENLRFSNIYADGESGILLYGCEGSLIRDLSFENLHLRLRDGPLQVGYGGNFDLRTASDLRQAIFAHDIPGMYCRYVDGLRVKGFRMDWDEQTPDFFDHAIHIEDSRNVLIDGFEGRQPQEIGAAIALNRVKEISISNSKAADGTDIFLDCENTEDERLFARNDLLHARMDLQPGDAGFKLVGNLLPRCIDNNDGKIQSP
jgi:hypothetical protein